MPPDTPTQAVRHEKGTTNYVVGQDEGKVELYIDRGAKEGRIVAGGNVHDGDGFFRRELFAPVNQRAQVLAFDVRQGAATRVEKMVTFYTSRDPAISDTLVKASSRRPASIFERSSRSLIIFCRWPALSEITSAASN